MSKNFANFGSIIDSPEFLAGITGLLNFILRSPFENVRTFWMQINCSIGTWTMKWDQDRLWGCISWQIKLAKHAASQPSLGNRLSLSTKLVVVVVMVVVMVVVLVLLLAGAGFVNCTFRYFGARLLFNAMQLGLGKLSDSHLFTKMVHTNNILHQCAAELGWAGLSCKNLVWVSGWARLAGPGGA